MVPSFLLFLDFYLPDKRGRRSTRDIYGREDERGEVWASGLGVKGGRGGGRKNVPHATNHVQQTRGTLEMQTLESFLFKVHGWISHCYGIQGKEVHRVFFHENRVNLCVLYPTYTVSFNNRCSRSSR